MRRDESKLEATSVSCFASANSIPRYYLLYNVDESDIVQKIQLILESKERLF